MARGDEQGGRGHEGDHQTPQDQREQPPGELEVQPQLHEGGGQGPHQPGQQVNTKYCHLPKEKHTKMEFLF